MTDAPNPISITPAPGTPVKVTVEYTQPETNNFIFDRINSIELIGANTAQAFQQAQSIFNQPDPKADNLWQNLTPLAQDLVQYVEQAHNAIETATAMAAKAEAEKHAQATVPSNALKNVTIISPSAPQANLSA